MRTSYSVCCAFTSICNSSFDLSITTCCTSTHKGNVSIAHTPPSLLVSASLLSHLVINVFVWCFRLGDFDYQKHYQRFRREIKKMEHVIVPCILDYGFVEFWTWCWCSFAFNVFLWSSLLFFDTVVFCQRAVKTAVFDHFLFQGVQEWKMMRWSQAVKCNGRQECCISSIICCPNYDAKFHEIENVHVPAVDSGNTACMWKINKETCFVLLSVVLVLSLIDNDSPACCCRSKLLDWTWTRLPTLWQASTPTNREKRYLSSDTAAQHLQHHQHHGTHICELCCGCSRFACCSDTSTHGSHT